VPSPNSPSAVIACSPEDTEEIGRDLAAGLAAGQVVAVRGDLGVGKSVLVRAAAARLGVTERMPSPSYTIVEQYEARVPVLHVDLYRIVEEAEFEMLGIEEQMERAVTFVEWPERAPQFLLSADIEVTIEIDPGRDGCRRIRVLRRGA
jgi:tRNA threonylcarbamoyl adenosine modification protein YjeE